MQDQQVFFLSLQSLEKTDGFLSEGQRRSVLSFGSFPAFSEESFWERCPDTMDQVQLQRKQTEFPLKSMGVAPADFGIEYGPICGYYKGSVSKVSSGLFYGNADLAPGTSEDQ